MAEIQSKRLKMQADSEKERRKEREALLEFRREEAAANRRHELQLANMYMQILSAQTAPTPVSSAATLPFWQSTGQNIGHSELGSPQMPTLRSPPNRNRNQEEEINPYWPNNSGLHNSNDRDSQY